jgi:hypothetical protein
MHHWEDSFSARIFEWIKNNVKVGKFDENNSK